MTRRIILLLALALAAVACGDNTGSSSEMPDLPPISGEELEQLLTDSDRPAVVNVWASWCHPCRSEAPLLSAAHERFGDQVSFIGIDVQDNQSDAKDFISQFGLDFEHYFDRDRSVPNFYAGIGTPITFFFDDEGRLMDTHLGVIDERALALGIDELLNQ